MITRRYRLRAARAGLFAWSLGFVLAPLAHLWGHRLDHHHHGEGVLWTLGGDDDHTHAHDDHGHAHGAEPGHADADPLEHGDGTGHLQAAVLAAPVILPIFHGRLPAEITVDAGAEAPIRARAWTPHHPRAPPAA